MTNHHVDPHLLVVLGATSDLMRRKLLPAIYRLRTGGAVPGPSSSWGRPGRRD